MSQSVHQPGPDEIIPAVLSATQDVFSTMLSLPLEPAQPREEASDPAAFDGVVALVGIAGDWVGTGRVSCSAQFACLIAGALLMSPPFESVNEEVLDAVAEVSNMIIGNVKTFFEERLGSMALSIPTVVFGRNYQTRSAKVLQWHVIPFRSGGEILEVRFCLMPGNARPHSPQGANHGSETDARTTGPAACSRR
jgi:chemotaxis protein CheX